MEDDHKQKSTTAQREEEILRFWQERRIFERTLEKPSPAGEFVFYEGPPTANGRPGIHHLEARAFKDAIPRYRSMRGYHVRRRGGWDTHGLPVELEVEKQLGLKSKKEIEGYGVAQFNEKCRESVWKYVDEWRRFTERSGYWVDLDNAYVTYKPEYIESVWGILKHVHERGLLYKDYKVVPWCPRCGTALSSHELAQGYADVKDLSVYVKFKVKPGQKIEKWTTDDCTYILAWTTTPWTLPGNIALAVGEGITYDLISYQGEHFIVARQATDRLFGEATEVERHFLGLNLTEVCYDPPYPFLQISAIAQQKNFANAFKVYTADFVSTTEGTGIVHTAVMYGQDDFELGTKVGLPKHHLVDESGHFIKGTGFLEGKFVRDEETAIEIIKDLAHRSLLFKKEKYEHSYPHCWRCKTPLIYYARDSWYIRMSELRDELVKENEGVNWIPAHIKEGRFGEWLREVKDWAISRERYWGTPLPIWRSADGAKTLVVDSLDTLKKHTKKSGNRYFVMRHGEALWNMRDVLNADPTVAENHLTEHGVVEVDAAARELTGRGIDLIVHSPLPRARETAERVARALAVADVREDPRLAEISFGEFEGKSVAEYHAFFGASGERLTKRLEGGETWGDVKRRVTELLYELETREHERCVLIVSHNGTIQMLFAGAAGLTREASSAAIEDVRFDIATAEVKPLDFVPVPHNADYELDLHRPYIDDVTLCARDGTELSRVREVLDVWFDSGAMPFAQDGGTGSEHTLLYPADFISEAIDQTRGWFYTLHAIGVLMGRGKAYKNVISLGHILDVEGKKMSKSVGNVVNPWDMIEQYGADALRFWMYTVNQPGDSKNFDEKTVAEIIRKVHNLLLNSLRFYELYAVDTEASYESAHDLDRLILARLGELIRTMTEDLDQFEVFEPAREVREFIADLSQGYIRRSRERFKGDDAEDKRQAVGTTRFVLETLARLMAPFTPFLAEHVYQRVKGRDAPESVHLAEWPHPWGIDKKILKMGAVLDAHMSFGLRAREGFRIPVRQPLEQYTVEKWGKVALSDSLLEVLREGLNVKRVNIEKALVGDLAEGTMASTITNELKEEGEARAFTRALQELRKKAGLAPQDQASVVYVADEAGEAWMREHGANISARTKVEFEKVESVEGGEVYKIGSIVITLGAPSSK
ncbi:MAG: class I tRNA ligase family protein [Patescibacteria group bacterium]|nr:class I tRNA ligase family protein [Patescibacteria group bacterium]